MIFREKTTKLIQCLIERTRKKEERKKIFSKSRENNKLVYTHTHCSSKVILSIDFELKNKSEIRMKKQIFFINLTKNEIFISEYGKYYFIDRTNSDNEFDWCY